MAAPPPSCFGRRPEENSASAVAAQEAGAAEGTELLQPSGAFCTAFRCGGRCTFQPPGLANPILPYISVREAESRVDRWSRSRSPSPAQQEGDSTTEGTVSETNRRVVRDGPQPGAALTAARQKPHCLVTRRSQPARLDREQHPLAPPRVQSRTVARPSASFSCVPIGSTGRTFE